MARLITPNKPTLVTKDGKSVSPLPSLDPPAHWMQNPNDDNEAVRGYGALLVSVKIVLLPPQPPSVRPSPIAQATVMNLATDQAAAHFFKSPKEAFAFFDLVLDAAATKVQTPEKPEVTDHKNPE